MKHFDNNKAFARLLVLAFPLTALALDTPSHSLSIENVDAKRATTSFGRKLHFFFSPSEWSCRRDLDQCVAEKTEQGGVTLEQWSILLEQALDEDDQSATITEKLQSFLQKESSQFSFSDFLDEMGTSTNIFEELFAILRKANQSSFAEAFDEMKNTMPSTEIEEIVASTIAFTESAKEKETAQMMFVQGDVSENDICAAKFAAGEWFSDVIFPFANSLPPLIGSPIFAVGLVVLLLKAFIWAIGCGHPNEGLPASPILDHIIDFFDQFQLSARRAFTGAPLLRSSVFCEADLLACEQESLLSRELPAILKDAFVSAGNNV